ncbi:type II secretion system F family protein [bacterium]|nr:type II secretion system F family protein [bacterium]MCB9479920.1 type II secretion system F family protein [Deltaproteobacteria bacterium]
MAEEKKPTKGKSTGAKKKTSDDVSATIKDSIMAKMAEEQTSARPAESPSASSAPAESRPAAAAAPRLERTPTYSAPRSGARMVRRKVDAREIGIFLRQVSILLSAGVPLARALQTLINRTRNHDFRIVLSEILQDVEKGEQFWVALSKHPQLFDSMVVNVIRTGEESGSLVRVTTYLANYRDREAEMVRNAQRAVTYPLFVAVIAIAVLIVVIVAVIPGFATQFAAANVELPWPTKILVNLSSILTNAWLILFVFGGLGYLFYKNIERRGGIKPAVDRFKLSIPIFGHILTNIYTVQFASMMSILMKAGLPMLRTLDLVQETQSNHQFHEAFAQIRDNVERGRSLQESFAVHTVFPPMVQDLVAVGEDAGTMPEVLDQLADIYQKEVDHETAMMSSLLEPIFISAMGLVVLFIVVAIFMPYVGMIKVIAG